jgi:tRNA(Arg) A34 adenosine deaminase TadA
MDEYMRRAVEIARAGIDRKVGGPFGAVIVKDGLILGEGSNAVTSTNDPTAHAEIVAIRHACRRVDSFSLQGATLYTTCEPCPMCYGAIFWTRIDRIVYAADRAGAARVGFDDNILWQDVAQAPRSRRLNMQHEPSPEADALFAQWAAMSDKTPY